MRSVLRTAFLVAVPVEVFNFWVVGYPAGTHTFSSFAHNAALALQWDVLHLPGIIIVDHSSYLRVHDWPCSAVLVLCGYVDTALLILALIGLFRLARSLVRKLASSRKTPVHSEESTTTRLSA